MLRTDRDISGPVEPKPSELDGQKIIVGMDPSLTNWGVVVFTYPQRWPIKLKIVDAAVITTEPTKQKKTVRAGSDKLARAVVLAREVSRMCGPAEAIFAEIPTGSQSQAAACGIGIVCGVLACMSHSISHHGGVFYEVSPDEVKRLVTSRRSLCGKASSVAWAKGLGFDLSEFGAKAHHVADAIAAVAVRMGEETLRQ